MTSIVVMHVRPVSGDCAGCVVRASTIHGFVFCALGVIAADHAPYYETAELSFDRCGASRGYLRRSSVRVFYFCFRVRHLVGFEPRAEGSQPQLSSERIPGRPLRSVPMSFKYVSPIPGSVAFRRCPQMCRVVENRRLHVKGEYRNLSAVMGGCG